MKIKVYVLVISIFCTNVARQNFQYFISIIPHKYLLKFIIKVNTHFLHSWNCWTNTALIPSQCVCACVGRGCRGGVVTATFLKRTGCFVTISAKYSEVIGFGSYFWCILYVPSLLFRTCPALLCLRYQPSCPCKSKKLSEGKETPCLSLYKSDLFDPGQSLNMCQFFIFIKTEEMIPDPPTSESSIS